MQRDKVSKTTHGDDRMEKYSEKEWAAFRKEYYKALEKLKRGKISTDDFLQSFHGNPFADYEVSKMFREGTLLPLDSEKADDWRRWACNSGSIEACLEIIQQPIGADEDPAGFYDKRVDAVNEGMVYKTEKKIDRHTVREYGHLNEDFFNEAVARASEHPEIAAGLAAYYWKERETGEFEFWADKSPESYRPYIEYMRAADILREYDESGNVKSIPVAVEKLEKASETYWRASFELGRLYFCGLKTEHDERKAFEYFLDAAERCGDNEEPKIWLSYYIDPENDKTAYDEELKAFRELRYNGMAIREINVPDRMLMIHYPEWFILENVTNSEYHMCCYFENRCNNRGGYENQLFALRPYDWDGESEEPNFQFKPTNFEIEWYKYPFRDSYMNQKLTLSELRHMWRLCIDSVIEENIEEYREKTAINGGE